MNGEKWTKESRIKEDEMLYVNRNTGSSFFKTLFWFIFIYLYFWVYLFLLFPSLFFCVGDKWTVEVDDWRTRTMKDPTSRGTPDCVVGSCRYLRVRVTPERLYRGSLVLFFRLDWVGLSSFPFTFIIIKTYGDINTFDPVSITPKSWEHFYTIGP